MAELVQHAKWSLARPRRFSRSGEMKFIADCRNEAGEFTKMLSYRHNVKMVLPVSLRQLD